MTNMDPAMHGADFYKNDTLSRSRNPENDTLFSGTSPYRKIYELYEYPPPPSPLGINARQVTCLIEFGCILLCKTDFKCNVLGHFNRLKSIMLKIVHEHGPKYLAWKAFAVKKIRSIFTA